MNTNEDRLPVIGLRVNKDYKDRFEAMVTPSCRSNAAILRHLLDRYMSGDLVPAKEKPKQKSLAVSSEVDQAYKDAFDMKRKQDGLSVGDLVERLIDACEAEKNQGAAK